jgi:DNA-directed RNA polymerase I subunit RPA43
MLPRPRRLQSKANIYHPNRPSSSTQLRSTLPCRQSRTNSLEHISPLLLTYYPPMKGVVLSYTNPRLSESPETGSKIAKGKESKTVLGRSVDEYAVTYVWLTVELLVFKPQRGTVLEGYVNLQNESILGLICYNYFNAGIERSRLPKDWQWVAEEAPEESGEMSRKGRREAAGHYVNAEGNKVEGKIVFKVKDFEATAGAETGSGSINIYGTLLVESEDKKVDEESRQKNLVRERPARR